MLAARTGNAAAVSELLQHGAEVNAQNDAGETALMVCLASLVRPLVEAGADVNQRSTKGGIRTLINSETALMMSSDVEKTRALLAAGAQVNARGALGDTALMHAALRAESDQVSVLLEAGADPKAKRDGGRTALMDAAYQADAATVRLLLNAGADVAARDLDGRTALHLAAMNLHRGVVEAVLAAHPDINSQATDGSTPLLLAARDAVVENVRTLLAAGADPSIRNAAGQTAMQWATVRGNQVIVGLLREVGARDQAAATPGLDDMKRAERNQRDGALAIFTTDVLTDGGVAKIRGRVRNNYTQRVEGIRFEVVLLDAGSLRLLDTLRQEVETALDPGQEAPLHLDMRSMYLGAEPRFLVQAFPVKLVGAR